MYTMDELETLLKNHDWSNINHGLNHDHIGAGYATRPAVDQAMRECAGSEATALWEHHCPWSDTNGGYAAWCK